VHAAEGENMEAGSMMSLPAAEVVGEELGDLRIRPGY
jgi:hypothetical protein